MRHCKADLCNAFAWLNMCDRFCFWKVTKLCVLLLLFFVVVVVFFFYSIF